jgi:hypothetical protein
LWGALERGESVRSRLVRVSRLRKRALGRRSIGLRRK